MPKALFKKLTLSLSFSAIILSNSACVPQSSSPSQDIPDWETHQGNSSHTGYVPITLDPSKFIESWSWERSKTGVINAINSPVASEGLVFVSEDDYHREVSLFALNESNGSVVWRYNFGKVPALNPPAVSGGLVFVTTSGHEASFIWVFESKTGNLVGKSSFQSQWPHYLAPTVFDSAAYYNTGYYGGKIKATDTQGNLIWTSESYGDNDMFTPAVDEKVVYQYSGTALNLLNRKTGELISSIDDPTPDETGYGHYGSTVIGDNGNIYAFSGDGFSGKASSSTEPYGARRLTSYDITKENIAWKTQSAYLTHPAVANGYLFAASNDPLRLEAIDESTGLVEWHWVPQNSGVTTFRSNIIATDSHILVSSNLGIHAISRKTKKEEWFKNTPGRLAISPKGLLLITEGQKESTGKLITVDLYGG